MKHKNEAIIIGWISVGKPADCGETMKNQLMIRKMEELGVHCRQMDFKNWKKHPLVLFRLAWNMIVHKNNPLIFSTSAINVYPMMKLMKILRWKQHCVHWVIGGSLGNLVQNGTFRKDVIGYMNWTLVESSLMADQLISSGIKNVLTVPNFKPIPYYPTITTKTVRSNDKDNHMNFVFIGRIMAEKGCDYILEAARQLNEMSYQNNYTVDFYGKVDSNYENKFFEQVDKLDNIHYRGFLNLRENSGYDKLSTYDMMLFPTYWKGEGLAGVFIDALISGVPMIVSDWAHNREFMEEGKTAFYIPVHNITALRDKIRECIDGKYDIGQMSIACQEKAETYNVDNIITEELLRYIGIMH